MPPRLNLFSACKALSSRAFAQRPPPLGPAVLARGMADITPPPRPSTTGITNPANEEALGKLRLIEYGLNPADVAVEGHKYGVPELPLQRDKNAKHRYDDVINQITRLLMRDGKLAKAQRDMALILKYLRTSPPPRLDPARPLLPGAPPAAHLPLDPITYLGLAIDSVAPLIKLRGFHKMAGGGKSLDVPIPLRVRQRRRIAFQWILGVVTKRVSKGSGRTMFPHRLAEEIVAVVEGRSAVWEKRTQIHKLGTTNRANLNNMKVRRML